MVEHSFASAVFRRLLRLALAIPAFTLVAAAFLDQGPSGEPRVSIFPLVLTALDPFTWTCVRNSLIFAGVNTFAAVILGGSLGWLIGRRPSWLGSLARAGVTSVLAVIPAFVALGIIGLCGRPGAWPWPFLAVAPAQAGPSLESSSGLGLWLVWSWSSLPAAIAMIALEAAAAVERLQPSWVDAARLAGIAPWRTWRGLNWPLVRPRIARTASIIFALSLVEPGAPLVLGLRRTIAFQIVESASRAADFPRTAIWCVFAAAIAWAGAFAFSWWGRQVVREGAGDPLAKSPVEPNRQRGSKAGATAAILIVTMLLAAAWLPVAGLARLALAGLPATSSPARVGSIRGLSIVAAQLVSPEFLGPAWNSLILGLEVGLGVMLVRGLTGALRTNGRGSQWIARQPLTLGVGLLAVPWLLALSSQALSPNGGVARSLAEAGRWLSADRDPWILLTLAVGMTLLATGSAMADAGEPLGAPASPSGFEIARLVGFSRLRSRWLGHGGSWLRWFSQFLATAGFAANNLAPALLIASWTDGQTLAVRAVALAGDSPAVPAPVTALVLTAVAVNLAAFALPHGLRGPHAETSRSRILG
jgi:ABC-type Fe3+ transport system permease subunit